MGSFKGVCVFHWNFFFRGERKVPGEKPSEQGREPTTYSAHIYHLKLFTEQK